MRGQRGFTLIEVMVAILLMALVSLVAWRGLDSVSRSDAHLQAAAERNDELLRALNQLQRDLAQRATTELLEPLRPDADAGALPIRPGPPALVLRGGGNGPPRLAPVRVAPSRPGRLLRVR
ncbi:PulJ/GspJ family protein, partial [Pseudomonas tohonis]|uniref:PulJ/GspJ family protein n=1 Tax=Pseudomonas tohonis TaxID=2725477 RepID=UPI001F46C309